MTVEMWCEPLYLLFISDEQVGQDSNYSSRIQNGHGPGDANCVVAGFFSPATKQLLNHDPETYFQFSMLSLAQDRFFGQLLQFNLFLFIYPLPRGFLLLFHSVCHTLTASCGLAGWPMPGFWPQVCPSLSPFLS